MRLRRRQSVLAGSLDRRFPPDCRIRRRSEFLRIQREQRGRRTPHFVVISATGPGPHARIGITVSRRIGSAVIRNRVKRRVREFFRLYRGKLQPAYDHVVIARAGAGELEYQQVASELAAALGILT